MVLAETSGSDTFHPRRPNPFSHTADPRRPTTTDAPGYPPAVIPRWITWSIVARRSADIPTVVGLATGKPSPWAKAANATVEKRRENNGESGLGSGDSGQEGETLHPLRLAATRCSHTGRQKRDDQDWAEVTRAQGFAT